MSQTNLINGNGNVYVPAGSSNTLGGGDDGSGSAVSSSTLSGTSSSSVDGTKSFVNVNGVNAFEPQQTTGSVQGGDADSAPTLPDVAGSRGATGQAQGAVASWLTIKPGSLSQALSMLSDMAANNMQTMQKIRTEAGFNEYTTQQQSADQLVAQVQGERTSAWTQFAGSMIGVGLSFGAAFAGGAMGANSPTSKVAGFAAALSGLATPITTVTNNTTSLIDKTEGGQYQADQAKIAKSYLDMLQTIFKSEDDSFNSEVQNAQKSLQNVWDLTRSVNDSNSQTLINTNSNV